MIKNNKIQSTYFTRGAYNNAPLFLYIKYNIGCNINTKKRTPDVQNIQKGTMHMKYTIILENETEEICIPKTTEQYTEIEIQCSQNIENTQNLLTLINQIHKLHHNADIFLRCNIIDNLDIILQHIKGLAINLYTSQDFEKFLDMDNQLNYNDTTNKILELHTTSNVNIDGCKPADLPLIWHVFTDITI